MNDCLFCKIVKNQLPATKVHEDEHTLAFKDIHPKAPVHLLVIPKEHFTGIHDVPLEKIDVITQVFKAVHSIVTKNNLIENGYRLVINAGEKAGQVVGHLHVHILSGREMRGF